MNRQISTCGRMQGCGMDMRLSSACIHTVSHGDALLTEFCEKGGILTAQTELASFALHRIDEEELSLYRVSAGLCRSEDANGELITLPAKGAVELELTAGGAVDAASGPVPADEAGAFSCMALYQHKPWWMRPIFPETFADIPERTQLLIRYCEAEALFYVMMAVCSDRTRADLCGTKNGIRISLSSNQAGNTKLDEAAFICGAGKDPYGLIGKMCRMIRDDRQSGFRMREEKHLPGMFRSLGWCTWDSLRQDVCEAAILAKMDELREKKVPVRWVLIDDGWSLLNMETKQLKGFRADPAKFPEGLSGTVRRLKEEYGVEKVGVWQAFKGYWCGVAEDFEDWRSAGACLQTYGNGEISVRPEASASFGFWDAWHSALEKEGIDFVKIDGQSSMQMASRGAVTYGEGLRALNKGMEASVLLHFDGNLINCMGMAPESVFSRSSTALSRTSDDYLPEARGSFYEHAMQNAYNNVYQGALYYGDFDMFWTEHEDAERSAVLRLIGGSPVYISDAAGRTDPAVIRRMTGADGNLLMCTDIGRPTLDCLTKSPYAGTGQESDGVLKLYNRCGDTVVMACFAGERDAEANVRLSDIPGLPARQYVLINSRTGEVIRCEQEQAYRFAVGAGEALVLQLIPEENGLAVAGLTEKYIPAAGIVSVLPEGDRVDIVAADSGPLAFAAVREVDSVYAGSTRLQVEKNRDLLSVSIPEGESEISVFLK